VQRSLIDDGRISVVDIVPANPRSLGVTWLEMQGELLLQAGQGGRWELDRSKADVAVIELITRSLPRVVRARADLRASPSAL
jgi:hypothetical protein